MDRSQHAVSVQGACLHVCVCDLILCHIYLYPYNCLLTDVRSPSVLPGQVLTRAAVHVNEMCVLSE